MSSWPSLLLAVLLCAPAAAQRPERFPGIGRSATPQELAAWDTDVRADFKGLPKGSGSVAQGQLIWEAKCASCHGVFGESNQVFAPIVGGTTEADVQRGRVAALADNSFPGRTTLMKLATVSTLWDYIYRAMPWTQPRSLSADEVYAVTAYVLHLGGVLPGDFVLADGNIAQVQQRLPNRHGMSGAHALWPGAARGSAAVPDVRNSACMSRCEGEPRIVSSMPEHALNNHGNLADQQRSVGPMRGQQTAAVRTAAAAPAAAAPLALLNRHNCMACHGLDSKVVGPGLREIAARHAGRADAQAYFGERIRAGSQGLWGAIPMPPQSLPDNDLQQIARWLATGAGP